MQTKIDSQKLPEQFMSWTDFWGNIEDIALELDFVDIPILPKIDLVVHRKTKPSSTTALKSILFEVEYIDAMARRERLIADYENEHNYIQQQKNLGVQELDTKAYDFADEYKEDDTIPIQLVINEINKRLTLLRSKDCTLELIDELNY